MPTSTVLQKDCEGGIDLNGVAQGGASAMHLENVDLHPRAPKEVV